MISELKTFYRIYADTRNENTGKIVAKQNDTKTRYLDITVTDNGVPVDLTGCEVRIYGRKKDGTEFYNDGTLQDAENGRCLFEATTQMLAYAGQNVNCEIVVFKDNEQILSTMPFDIFVVESLMGASAIESSNEYGALVILYQNLYEAIDLMTTMVQNIGSPSTVAEQYNLETMWQAWEFLVAYMKGDLTDKMDEALANSSIQGVLDKLDSMETEITNDSQEILDKVSGGTNEHRVPIFAGGKYTASSTVVSVTGKGRLYFALGEIYNSKDSAKTAQFKIVIDGETVFHVKATSTTSYPIRVYGGIAPINSLYGSSYNNGITSSILVNDGDALTDHYIHNSYGTEVISELSATERTYKGTSTTTNTLTKTDHVFINDYLVFNESLTVSVTYGNSACNVGVAYSLDE